MPKWQKVSPNILQHLIWVPTRFIFSFFFNWKVAGLENIANIKRGVIFALNHTSELDVFALPAAFPFRSRLFPMFYLARPKSFYSASRWRRHFYGGKFFLLWGAHLVNDNLHNYENALSNHVAILNSGGSVCVFPEGRVTRGGLLHEGRGGVCYLAWRSGCPIVPVGIKGLWRVTSREFFMRRREVSVTFGKPMIISDLFGSCAMKPKVTQERNDFHESASVVMQRIAEMV